MRHEIRSQNGTPIRLEGNTLYGTAIPYNSLSHDLGGFQERFMPGSVAETIKSGLVEAWLYHDSSMPIGSQAAGTLRLRDDERGLHYEVDLPDTSYVADFKKLMDGKRKEVSGTSFGFNAEDGGDKWTREDGKVIRTVSRARLQHISPVITPAYAATTASLRSYAHGDLNVDDLYGLDIQQLAQIFVSINKGLSLDHKEIEIAQLAINQLRSVLPRPKLKAAAAMAQRVLL